MDGHFLGAERRRSSVISANLPQTLSGRVRNFANMSKPVVDILFTSSEDSQSSTRPFIPTFSTRDKIDGTAYFTAQTDTPFDEVEIAFTGSVKTYVDRVGTVSAVNPRTEAFHHFLKLTQPIDEAEYPSPRVAQAGKTYAFPFTFVVPDELLPSSCRHKSNNPKIQDAHLQLPPSMGDPDMAGTSNQLQDDMSPAMVRISYAIKARMVRNRLRDGKEALVADKVKKVRIIPATLEQPPVDIEGLEDEYTLRKEKGIRKGMFKSKAGRITAEVAQPKCLRLPAPSSERRSSADAAAEAPATTMAAVMLRYDPAEADAQPPRLNSLSSKLRVTTFFSSVPLRDFPSKTKLMYESNSGVHMETLPLSSRCVANVQWERHEPGTHFSSINYRRGSTSSDLVGDFCPEPSKQYDPRKPFYTARLLVPITLPTNKSFVPTFFSCLASRVYVAELCLSISNPSGATAVPTTLTLKAPVQIASDSNESSRRGSALDSSQQEEQAMREQGHINEYFMPRSIAPPPAHFLEQGRIGSPPRSAPTSPQNPANDLPPEYSYFATAGAGTVPVCG